MGQYHATIRLHLERMMQDRPNYFLIAIKEILQEFKVNPALQLDSKLALAFKITDDGHQPIKQLMTDLNFQDFEWQYFDECTKFCLENNIVPQGYDFLTKYPKFPNNTTEFLNHFTINQLRELAKLKNINRLPTRKDDIIAHIATQAQLSDFKNEIKELLKRQLTAYKQAVLKAKCQFLISAVFTRAHALRDMKELVYQQKVFYYDAKLHGLQLLDDDDWALARHLIGEYPQPNNQTGRINTNSLPPYFLGDTVYLSCSIDRDKSKQVRQQHIAEIHKQHTPTIQAQTHKNKEIEDETESTDTVYLSNTQRNIYCFILICLCLFMINFPEKLLLILIGIVFVIYSMIKYTIKSNLNTEKRTIYLYIGKITAMVIGALVAIKLFFGVISGDIPLFNRKQSDTRQQQLARILCEDKVKTLLKAPTQATFSSSNIAPNGNGYTITGTVDSPNSFGVKLRSTYSCQATPSGKGFIVQANVSSN